MTTTDIAQLLEVARHTADHEVFEKAMRELLRVVWEWSSLRKPVFLLVSQSNTECNPRLAFACAEYCQMDDLLEDNVDTELLDTACTMILILSAGGEDWFGEPELEGWIDAQSNLEHLSCGAIALPRLIEAAKLQGWRFEHALTLACIKVWTDFWIDAENDPLAVSELEELSKRGWSLDHLRSVAGEAVTAMQEPRFDNLVAEGIERNDRDAMAVHYLRNGQKFDWFIWKARQQLRKRTRLIFGDEIIDVKDDDDIRSILRYCGNENLLVALSCADRDTRTRVVNCMARRTSVVFLKALELMQPPSGEKIEQASMGVLQTVQALIDEGTLILCSGNNTLKDDMETALSGSPATAEPSS